MPSQIDWKNEEVIKNVHSQMKQLTTYLSNIGVKINLIENRIGISETKMIKYFMGLDFQWEDSADENALAEHY